MFNVDMTRLKRPLRDRRLSFIKNNDGTVTIDGKLFDRESDVENYLMQIKRKDFT